MTKIIRDLTPKNWVVPDLPERYLFDLRTECNLACPMCLLHGAPDSPEKEAAIGQMGIERSRKLLDEIMVAKPLIQPTMWGEPLLAKDLKEQLRAMKERGIAVAMNTNGLTLREETCRFFVDVKLDSIFFSLDSTTPATLKKVRGIDKLEKIKRNVMMMLRVRKEMNSIYPRIGTTFAIQEANRHEMDEFVKQWVGIVDCVRTQLVFDGTSLPDAKPPEKRVPCAMIYHTMPIHYNGDVSICCYDSHRRAIMGNVFNDGGVRAVWHGEKFSELRHLHETGRYDKVPFCKDCNAWAGHVYTEEMDEVAGVKVVIRRSSQFTYYNRIDRLESWHEHMRGHTELDKVAIKESLEADAPAE